jgi:hypothetical protein
VLVDRPALERAEGLMKASGLFNTDQIRPVIEARMWARSKGAAASKVPGATEFIVEIVPEINPRGRPSAVLFRKFYPRVAMKWPRGDPPQKIAPFQGGVPLRCLGGAKSSPDDGNCSFDDVLVDLSRWPMVKITGRERSPSPQSLFYKPFPLQLSRR